jgi:hypothetical protein
MPYVTEDRFGTQRKCRSRELSFSAFFPLSELVYCQTKLIHGFVSSLNLPNPLFSRIKAIIKVYFSVGMVVSGGASTGLGTLGLLASIIGCFLGKQAQFKLHTQLPEPSSTIRPEHPPILVDLCQ